MKREIVNTEVKTEISLTFDDIKQALRDYCQKQKGCKIKDFSVIKIDQSGYFDSMIWQGGDSGEISMRLEAIEDSTHYWLLRDLVLLSFYNLGKHNELHKTSEEYQSEIAND
jgi:hypothetical protein